MTEIPLIHTTRLTLRALFQSDTAFILPLIQEKEVAATTLRIPHPCTDANVKAWFDQQQQDFTHGKSVRWAIVQPVEDHLIGIIKLVFHAEFESAELGYWIGKPYWGRGYATEAARVVLQFGFDTLQLNRIEAFAMIQNGASFRIFDKLGMQPEGYHRQLIKKWGVFRDVKSYSILRSEWLASIAV